MKKLLLIWISRKSFLINVCDENIINIRVPESFIETAKSFNLVIEKGLKGRPHFYVRLFGKSFSLGKPSYYTPEEFKVEDTILSEEVRSFDIDGITYNFVKANRKYIYEDPYFNKELKIWLLLGDEEAKKSLEPMDYVCMYSRNGSYQYPELVVRSLLDLINSLREELSSLNNSITN